MRTIATIRLEDGSGRGELYWRDGGIYCRTPNGDDVDAQIGCTEDEAEATIEAAWGCEGVEPWDIQWSV